LRLVQKLIAFQLRPKLRFCRSSFYRHLFVIVLLPIQPPTKTLFDYQISFRHTFRHAKTQHHSTLVSTFSASGAPLAPRSSLLAGSSTGLRPTVCSFGSPGSSTFLPLVSSRPSKPRTQSRTVLFTRAFSVSPLELSSPQRTSQCSLRFRSQRTHTRWHSSPSAVPSQAYVSALSLLFSSN
jgi:hypothetical protein